MKRLWAIIRVKVSIAVKIQRQLVGHVLAFHAAQASAGVVHREHTTVTAPPVGWCDSIDSCSAVGGFTLALSRRELDRVGLTRVIAVVDVRSHKGINI